MMISNNSSLLKDSQELTKTKQTIWKPLIAVSLLSIFSFISGQYLPYVIAAVSGSGAIEAVPLAIFAVSAVVALVSVICLIRLAVSRAGDKKKIDLSEEESGHTASQEPQKLVHENSTNLESKPIRKEFDKPVKQDSGSQIKVDSGTSSQDKSSVPISPSQSPQTRDTAASQVPHSVPPSPSSPPPAPNSNGTPSPGKTHSPSMSEARDDMLAQIRARGSFKLKNDNSKEKHYAEFDKLQEERRKRNENDSDLKKALEERLAVMAPSDSESEQSSWTSNEDEHEQTEPEQAEKEQIKYTNPPSSKEEGSVGLDSGIGSRATSPLYFEQKTEESPVPSNSHVASAAQVNNVGPVNSELQDPSISPVEDHTKFSASEGDVSYPS